MIFVFNWRANQRFLIIRVLSFIIFSIASPVLLLVIANFIKSFVWPEGVISEINLKSILESVYYLTIYFILLGGVYYLTRYRINYMKQKVKTIKIESLAKDTQLKMLRYQINPHFLFNILNSMHALVDENKEIAKKLIVCISEYYRSVLDKQIQNNTIEKEIEIVKKYFEIQKIRFEDSLEYKIDVDEKAGQIKIPAFVIHLLIENAIKYGSKFNNKKLIIKLFIRISQNTLSIIVKNTGRISISENQITGINDSTGSGIENMKNRLKLFFEDDVNFTLKAEEENWVTARIEINNFRNE
jgi:LytS/YehU family sensor histidine kinase